MQNIRISHEIRHIAGLRLIIHLIGCPQLFQHAFMHDADAVGHVDSLFLIMGDIDKSDPQTLLQPFQFQLHLSAQLQIQCSQRFI